MHPPAEKAAYAPDCLCLLHVVTVCCLCLLHVVTVCSLCLLHVVILCCPCHQYVCCHYMLSLHFIIVCFHCMLFVSLYVVVVCHGFSVCCLCLGMWSLSPLFLLYTDDEMVFSIVQTTVFQVMTTVVLNFIVVNSAVDFAMLLSLFLMFLSSILRPKYSSCCCSSMLALMLLLQLYLLLLTVSLAPLPMPVLLCTCVRTSHFACNLCSPAEQKLLLIPVRRNCQPIRCQI